LFAKITLSNVPEMVALLSDDESLNDLMALPPEDILLRWFNYQLEQAGCGRRVENFSDDVKVKAFKKEQGCSSEIPKRYQDPVLWAWLEIIFTSKRNQF